MKVKRFINKKLFKKDLAYEDWLNNFIKPLNNNELNQMGKEFSNFISANNTNFHPLKGA